MCVIYQSLFCIIFLPLIQSDYALYEVIAFNPRERALLYTLQMRAPSITFLNGVSNEAAIPMDVIVKLEIAQMFEGSLKSMNIQCQRVLLIKSDFVYLEYNSTAPSYNISANYYNWKDILKWIETNNNKLFQKVVVSKTFEKRDIFFLKLQRNAKYPAVFIVGGEEGMDWLSSAVILNLLNDFLANIDELKILIDNFSFYLLPILNPDGFDYSKKQDRFWTKNRRNLDTQTKCENYSVPVGVNIGRNWFFQKTLKRIGEECNSVYMGHRPLSQEENQSLVYVLNNLALNMIAFINVRGFGRCLTVPYADGQESNNHNIVMEILKSTCFKVRNKHNIPYDVGTTASFFYNFTGNMADWVKKKLNTPLVYTVYLDDEFSVLPHPKSIKLISQQFYTIIKESLLLTKDIYGPLFSDQIKVKINYRTIFIIQLFKHFFMRLDVSSK